MATRDKGNTNGGDNSNYTDMLLLNGESSYVSAVSYEYAHSLPEDSNVLVVSSIGNSFQSRLMQGMAKQDKDNLKNLLFSIDNPLIQIEKSIVKTDLKNLYLLPGLDNYSLKGRLHENENLMKYYAKSLEDLRDSNKYHTIIIEDGNRFDSLRILNLANKRYFFLDGEDAKLENQLNRINQALFAKIEYGFFKHCPEADVFTSSYNLERMTIAHSNLLFKLVNKKQTAEFVELYSAFKTIEEAVCKVMDKSKEKLRQSDIPLDIYFYINKLLRDGEGNIDSLRKGIEEINNSNLKNIMKVIIDNAIDDSKNILFYLPQDAELSKETANSGFPLPWHKYNKSLLQKKVENSDLTKSLERIVSLILNRDNPKNLAEVIYDKDDDKSYYFKGEFDEERKEYVKKIRDSIDRVYKQDMFQKQSQKHFSMSKFIKPYMFYTLLSILGITAGAKLAYNHISNNFKQQDNSSKFLLERTKKQHLENIGKIEVKKQEEVKKAEEAERQRIIKINEEKEKSLIIEREKKIEQQKTEQEKIRKEAEQKRIEAEQKAKKLSEEKARKEKIKIARQGMWHDKTFLSGLETMLEEQGGEVFNTDEVLIKNYQVGINDKRLEFRKGADIVFYVLEDSEVEKINELKERYIENYLKK